MKKSTIFIILLAIFGLTGVSFAALPGTGWWAGITVQNVGSLQASITITAYDANSSLSYQASGTIDPDSSRVFIASDFTGMPSGFIGSAVVESSEPVKAVVNVTNRTSGSLGVVGGKAAGIYQGVENGAATLYFPTAKGNHFNKTTTFFIQNTGTAAGTATATFKMRNGDTHTYTTPSIDLNKMVSFTVADSATFNPLTNDARIGSMSITSSASLAGVVTEHFTTESPATILQATRGFSNSEFDAKAYAPIVKNNRFGRFTGIQVQNVSAGPINVTVTYKGSAGTCAGNTYTDSTSGLAAGSAWTINQQAPGSNLPADCTASATISATGGNFVATVNESYVAGSIPPSGQSSVTSSAIPGSMATTKLVAPVFKDDRFDKRTGLMIQNVGTTTATNVVATFKCTGANTFTAVSNPLTLVSGASQLFNHPYVQGSLFTTPFVSDNVTCGVTVISDQPIVALANEGLKSGATIQQDNSNYEAFNLTP